jgi:hypothetical protein
MENKVQNCKFLRAELVVGAKIGTLKTKFSGRTTWEIGATIEPLLSSSALRYGI